MKGGNEMSMTNDWKPTNLYGVIGLILFLIFVYYIVVNPTGVSSIISSLFKGGTGVISTLKANPKG